MSLVFQCIQTGGIAELSYLVGDDSAGIAEVVDPTPAVDKYITLAREHTVSITHILETHIHIDLMSGARELCGRLGSAKVFVSHEGARALMSSRPPSAQYRFRAKGVGVT